MYFYSFSLLTILWMHTIYTMGQLERTITAEDNWNPWGVTKWTLCITSCVIPAHHSCQTLIRLFTLNDQMCCSCPIGPRAASHGPKLITEGNGKMLHLQTVQRDSFSLLANFFASHVAINLSCIKMKSIDQLNNGMITSLFFTALKCGSCSWSRFVAVVFVGLDYHEISVYIYEQYHLHMQAEDLHSQWMRSLGEFQLLLLYVLSQLQAIPLLSLHSFWSSQTIWWPIKPRLQWWTWESSRSRWKLIP